MTRPFVVFVCLHGSAKSVIAREHFHRLASERGIEADSASAGTEPDAEIPPGVLAGLTGDGIDVTGLAPRPVSAAELARASRVVSFGCDLGNAVPPGTPLERWDDVPAVSANYGRARDAIAERVRALVAGLA